MIVPGLTSRSLPDHLVYYVITTFFEQSRLDSTALIRGKTSGGDVYAWLYSGSMYSAISPADYDKFRRASRSRGGSYSLELCEFTIEEILDNGDVVLNFWRRVRDDTGEGGRVLLSYQGPTWVVSQILGGWENR